MNLPNKLTMFRICMVPVFLVLLCVNLPMSDTAMRIATAVVFAITSLTDMIDGKIARKYNLVSDFGKALDPFADKLTQAALLLCILPMKLWWVVGVMAFKEVSIGILTCLTLKRTGKIFSAGWYGKLCTVVIYLSMFILMLWRTAPTIFMSIRRCRSSRR